jgi:hypothetical protein
MPITRRQFLGRAAVTLALPRVADIHSVFAPSRAACTILDLLDQCALPESLAGYRAALAHVTPRAPVLVLPAALTVPVRAIERQLSSDAIVILESGAAFGDERAVERFRKSLGSHLGIESEPSITLPVPRVPYVDFTWPRRALVRDFSRVVPVVAPEGEIIATAAGLPVAVRRRTGRGMLVVLGSPLGPALWAGDVEARRWILDLLAP